LTLGSLFDGIGGFPYAGSFFGITPLWASEILPQAVSVTKRHFPDMAHIGDITQLDGGELPPVDIITFGSPCQDLSTAGKRAGMGGERSGLFYEAIRIIDEMREATNGEYPKYAVWENVPGALSSGHPRGSDFRAVLEAFTKTEISVPESNNWANAGLVRGDGVNIAWRLLNACLWGVPQRRRRLFLVASFGAGCPEEILFVEEGLRGYLEARGETREGITADAQRGIGGAVPVGDGAESDCLTPWDVQSRRVHAESGLWPALYSAESGGRGYAAVNCLNPWETQQSRVFTEDGASPTLAGADGGGGRNPAGLVFAAFLGGASAKARSIGYSEEVSPTLKSVACGYSSPCVCEPNIARTLTARGDSSPCADRGQNIIVTELPAVTMRLREGCVGGGKGPLLQNEMSGTLATGNDQYLFSPQAYGICALNSNSMLSENPHSGIYEADTSRTLDLNGGNPSCNQGGMAIVEAVGVHQNQSGEVSVSDTAYTLSTMSNASARNAPLVAHPKIAGTLCASGAGLSRPAGMASEPDLCVAFALAGNMVGRQERNGPNGSGISENLAFTLTATDIEAVAMANRQTPFIRERSDVFIDGDIASTQTARQCKDSTDLICEKNSLTCFSSSSYGGLTEGVGTVRASGGDNGGGSENLVMSESAVGYIVRRLTPIECERLQGFPDNWTQFGVNGEEISDSRRYQMLGNSVAIPCVAFILGGIAAQESAVRREES
jgi:DNA (cytosine-5)-methyltransferase 1